MSVVRYTGGGVYDLRDGPTWTEAGEEHDVDPGTADRLCGTDRFESVDDAQAEDAETCDTVQGNGDVCGRELPCPYHGGDS